LTVLKVQNCANQYARERAFDIAREYPPPSCLDASRRRTGFGRRKGRILIVDYAYGETRAS
jgi:hypothetical protein